MANYISQNSDLMAEWDFEENTKLGLDPDKLTCGSNKTAHWKCGKGHSWEEVIYKRVNGKECPFCSNKRVWIGYNDLPTLFPDLAKEWDFEGNRNIDIFIIVTCDRKCIGWNGCVFR